MHVMIMPMSTPRPDFRMAAFEASRPMDDRCRPRGFLLSLGSLGVCRIAFTYRQYHTHTGAHTLGKIRKRAKNVDPKTEFVLLPFSASRSPHWSHAPGSTEGYRCTVSALSHASDVATRTVLWMCAGPELAWQKAKMWGWQRTGPEEGGKGTEVERYRMTWYGGLL